jgi:hypothetical protein
LLPIIDSFMVMLHFSTVKSLQEIEEAIVKLPVKARRQLVKDIPALCPDAFPTDGWDAILYGESRHSYCKIGRPIPRPGDARYEYLRKKHA